MLKTYYFPCLSFLLIVIQCVRCEPDYVFNQEAAGWLKLHSTPDTWQNAFLKCLSEGAVLASPLNKDLAQALQSKATQSGVNGHIFLGTHDLYSKGHFASVEGVPLSNMDLSWGSGGNRENTRDCLTMSVDGSAYYSSCEQPLPFICYRKHDNQTMNECGTLDNECVRCEPDYVFNQEAAGWLKLHSTPDTWQNAFLKCLSEGAVLASPLNKDLAQALQSKATQSGVNGHIFLGTHDLYSKGHFASVEGVPLSNMDLSWGSGGNRENTRDCLTMSVDGSAYYSSCEQPLPFICYRKHDNQTMNECGTLDNEYHLNQHTGSCYKVHRGSQTWSSAYGICDSEGGHLVILNDEEEARIINAMFPDEAIQDARFHVGIVAWGEKRIWTTIHGQRIEEVYNRWTPGQPDNLGGIQDRGAVLKSGRLDDVGPAGPEWLPFVCEKSPESKRFEAAMQSGTKEPVPCVTSMTYTETVHRTLVVPNYYFSTH